MKLVASSLFEKKYKRIAIKNLKLKSTIDKILRIMEMDIYHPLLETHKLTGSLTGLWASSCGKDCRIIFKIEKSLISNEKSYYFSILENMTKYIDYDNVSPSPRRKKIQ